MSGHRIAMFGGAIWQLFRFIAVFFLVLRISPTDDPLFHIDLLWLSAGTILTTAMFFMSGARKEFEQPYLPVLRIGMLLHVVSDAAVVISQSYLMVDERLGFGQTGTRLAFLSVFGIMVVDLLILAALLSYRGRKAS